MSEISYEQRHEPASSAEPAEGRLAVNAIRRRALRNLIEDNLPYLRGYASRRHALGTFGLSGWETDRSAYSGLEKSPASANERFEQEIARAWLGEVDRRLRGEVGNEYEERYGGLYVQVHSSDYGEGPFQQFRAELPRVVRDWMLSRGHAANQEALAQMLEGLFPAYDDGVNPSVEVGGALLSSVVYMGRDLHEPEGVERVVGYTIIVQPSGAS